ncbi:hypothetical protein BOX15_Mlig001285g1, partial [Macrostomum lignano]
DPQQQLQTQSEQQQPVQLSLPKPSGRYLRVRIADQERSPDDRVAYVVETRVLDQEATPQELRDLLGSHALQTCRYYSDFDLLRGFLELKYPDCLIPPLPDKLSSYAPWKIAGQKFDQDFLDNRRFGLELFINRVLCHRRLSLCQQVVSFLRHDSEWRLRVFTPAIGQQLDAAISARSAAFRLRSPLPAVATMRTNAAAVRAAVQAVAKAYEQLVARHYRIHRLHSTLGGILSDWCGLEEDPAFADALQTAGHYMDVYASGADSAVGEDDELLNRLREAAGFCDSVAGLCRRLELKVLKAEQLEDAIAAKRDEKRRVETDSYGLSLRGLRTRLFGAQDAEQKRAALYQLETDISQLEAGLATARQCLDAGCASVDSEMADFQAQRRVDLGRLVALLCEMRAEKLHRACRIWAHSRDTFARV